MSIIDFIKKRKDVTYEESEGINLAVFLINEFKERKFSFKGLNNNYSGVTGRDLLKLLQEEMDGMLILYRYSTKVKKYTDKNGIPHLNIKLLGRAGTMHRYNPLDIEMNITTDI
jgi:hypothetical protein